MSNRVSEVVLLCEDDTQAQLVRAFLKICGQQGGVRDKVASRLKHGGNVGWVLDHFPEELQACRQRHKRARTLLIVMLDADDRTIEDRRRQLVARVVAADLERFGENEPAVLLIPKRHVETWIRVLLGYAVTEDENCKSNRKATTEQFRIAAQAIFDRSRQNAIPQEPSVPSLEQSLPHWGRISRELGGR